MRRRDKFWRRFGSGAELAIAVLMLLACSRPTRLRTGETFRIGEFQLRVQSVFAEDRHHQGVPLDVEIRLRCDGGNRFDRMDLAEALSKKGRVCFYAGGWRERVSVSTSGEDAHTLVAHSYPPPGSKGYMLRFDNPYGSPKQIEVDLGR